MRIAPQVVLNSEQRARLEAYARGRRTPARVVLRARIVLLAAEGKQDILAYIEEHNRQPKPFIWTAKANDILEKVKRAKANLNNSLSA